MPLNGLIHINTGNFYLGASRHGIASAELESVSSLLSNSARDVELGSASGLESEFACLTLGQTMMPLLRTIQDTAKLLATYRDIVLIGIGGSSLGAKAILQAITPDTTPRQLARLHFVENVDPYSLQRLVSRLDAAQTAVLCISKSGGTIETVVQYLILRDWLTQQLGNERARQQQWVVTDPENGWLRELAAREKLPSLPVPPRVGGRYSVLTAVGLLPLAAAGVDIDALLRGAADNAQRCSGNDIANNPALEVAALCYLLDVRHQKRTSVMMPYINRLQLFVDWYCQLWAESLGKWDQSQPGSSPAGTLPVRAMGAVDQHSQLQMYLESRHDTTSSSPSSSWSSGNITCQFRSMNTAVVISLTWTARTWWMS